MPTRYADIAATLPDHLAEFLDIPVAEVMARMARARDERNRLWVAADPHTEADREKLYQSLGELDLLKYAEWHRTDVEKQAIHDTAVQAAQARRAQVLDCGGGIGDTTLVFAANDVPVTYMEFPGLCYDFAHFRWRKFGCADRVTVREPAAFWTLAPGSYDLLISIDVLEHLENPVKFAARYHTLLRPGGLLFLTAHFHHSAKNPDHLPENDAYRRLFGGERRTARRSVLRNLGFKRRRWYRFVKP